MHPEFLEKLVCPYCQEDLQVVSVREQHDGSMDSGELACTSQNHSFRVENGVPILLEEGFFDWATINPDKRVNLLDDMNWKKMQVKYHHDENLDEATRAYELRRPHGQNRLFETMSLYDLTLAKSLYRPGFQGKSLLSFCCGRGMDPEVFWRGGAEIAGLDVVPSSLELVRARLNQIGGSIETICCDAERVPLKDSSFDICQVYDGLHHLPNPYTAIREMARIAREGIIIAEPNDSPVIRLTKWLGMTTEVEESGNYKHYFDARELERLLRSLGYEHTAVSFSLYKKFHYPPRLYDLLSHEPFYSLIRFALHAARKTFGRWSNHVIMVAYKTPR